MRCRVDWQMDIITSEEVAVSIIKIEELTMDAASYFETMSPFYQITLRHISEDRNIYSQEQRGIYMSRVLLSFGV
jgi:capsular polysaccharide biosynthesis protein